MAMGKEESKAASLFLTVLKEKVGIPMLSCAWNSNPFNTNCPL